MTNGLLIPEAQSLGSLTSSLRSGLAAISVLAFISFLSSLALFSYVSYKLVWYLYIEPPRRQDSHQRQRHFSTSHRSQRPSDFALGIDGVFNAHGSGVEEDASGPRRSSSTTVKLGRKGTEATMQKQQQQKPPRQPPNQFLILILNLLLADMHQGVAFLLNAEWLRRGAITVGTPTCFAQGLFISTGDLASSLFITAIAVHTYFSVVRRFRPSHRALYVTIAGIWAFVWAISTLPVAGTLNGRSKGGFFVRAGAWCWMNTEYENLRLLTHYLFIFLAIAVTSGLYLAIWLDIRRKARRSRQPSGSATDGSSSDGRATPLQLTHNPAFLIYPVIYILCTLPLALGRIATMAGADVPLPYMCFAGAMISSNGFFDCLLFGTTRNTIVFGGRDQVTRADTGLSTFAFLQNADVPRNYGNTIMILGGGDGCDDERRRDDNDGSATMGGWWSWKRGKSMLERTHNRKSSRTVSQESLRGPTTIQMDVVTTVVVECDDKGHAGARYPHSSTGSAAQSISSSSNQAFPARPTGGDKAML